MQNIFYLIAEHSGLLKYILNKLDQIVKIDSINDPILTKTL